MEDGKLNNNSINEENPSNNDMTVVTSDGNNDNSTNEGRGGAGGRRRPFTDLSQVDADLALARTLQEQERAYMMIRMNGGEGNVYGSWDHETYGHGDEDDDDFDDPSEEEYEGSDLGDDDNEAEEEEDDDDDDDAFDVLEHAESLEDESQNIEIDPSAYSTDEAYARALQDAEEREMAARLLAMAGINDMVVGEDEAEEDHGGNSQDTWEEVDPDELSYEELIALGDVVGTESRGLSADTIASLPSINYKSQSTQNGISDSCVICRLDYEDGETLTVLSCKHSYHGECINNWLQINKVCPVCSAEVSTCGNS